MAMKTATFPAIAGNQTSQSHYPMWNLANGDTGSASKFNGCDIMSFHLYGTPGAGGSVTIRGSNKPAPDPTVATDWFTMKDKQGNAATMTAVSGAGAGVTVEDFALWISPICTAGDGTTNLNVQGFGIRRAGQ